jgi:hypothetical protein
VEDPVHFIGGGKTMNEHLEEAVKLPEALSRELGKMVVQYQGYVESTEPTIDDSSYLLLETVWQRRRYDCRMLLPLEGVILNPRLMEDCRSHLEEYCMPDGEMEYRAAYLNKIDDLVNMAARRLYKKLAKTRELPVGLCPTKHRRRS